MVAKCVFLGLALIVLIQSVASNLCPTCGLTSGADVCGCSVNVVRPVRPSRIQPAPPRIVCTKVPGVEKFRPVGDICSCGQNIVSPAYVPKQRCSACQQRIQQSQVVDYPYPYALDYNLALPAPPQLNNFEPEENGGEYDYLNGVDGYTSSGKYANDDYFNSIYSPQQPLAPADAVSLTLAYGLQQQAARSVPEERLQFGFRQIPKDVPVQKQVVDIPEERLFTVDRQIVELKPNPRSYGCGTGSRLEEEAEEDLLQIQQEELEAQSEALAPGQSYLSYRDIGYVPESIRQQNQYIVNEAIQASQYDDLVNPTVLCNDGYVPGSVISRNEQLEYLEEADVSAAYSDEDDDFSYGVPSYPRPTNYGPSSFAANAGTGGVLIQKLSSSCGCQN